MKKLLGRSMQDASGATAVEYGLMLALIAVVLIVIVTLLGENIRDLFTNVALHSALGGS
jgi:pilus assembly protein Flp/PilA